MELESRIKKRPAPRAAPGKFIIASRAKEPISEN
jgi:hypothetical protein